MKFFHKLARLSPFCLLLNRLMTFRGENKVIDLSQPLTRPRTNFASTLDEATSHLESPTVGPSSVTTTAQNTPDGLTVVTLKDFYSKTLNNRRTVEIYLPPDYEANPTERYKVLYANDGQDMEALRLKPTLEELYRHQAIEKIIVVAIYAGTGERTNEYGTANIPNSYNQGAKAARYEQFLTDELMPYVNLKYRAKAGASNTAITGSSLGGLSAFDTAWHYPTLFGKVGVFSGSFWWRTDDTSVTTKQSSRIMLKKVQESAKHEGLKMWFQAGTQDEAADRDNNGVIDAIQDTTELMDELKLKGYRVGPDEDMIYVQVEGGKHNQETWARVLPDFLKWAFAAS